MQKRDIRRIKQRIPREERLLSVHQLGDYANAQGWWLQGVDFVRKHLDGTGPSELSALPYFDADEDRIFWLCHCNPLNTQVKTALIKAIGGGPPTQDGKVDTARANNARDAQTMEYLMLTTGAMQRYLSAADTLWPRSIVKPPESKRPQSTTGEAPSKQTQ